MSTLLKDARCVTSDSIPSYYHRSHVLRSRENVFKTKCNKALKKKLKKYKLRKDGQEDQDILDVSKTLVSSLRIKSPNSQHINQNQHLELEDRPNNYLFKMVRLRKTVSAVETSLTNPSPNISDTNEDTVISLTPKFNQDQDKKQMDAFKLLMDSRNKSIGTNSPGKEKSEQDSELQEKVDKKELKAKRILSLQKMAQAKGSLKNEKIEEYREECIKRKMEVRAKRLKKMIVGEELDKEKKNNHSCLNGEMIKKSLSPFNKEKPENKKSPNNKVPSPLTSIDLFEDSENSNVTPITKTVSKEDKEFLKKLAPSIRKKENMLSYFQKVSKDSDNSQNNSDNDQLDSDQFIIKVKLTPKNKTKKKNSKHIINENRVSPVAHENETNINLNSPTTNKSNHKRKRNINIKIDKEKITEATNASDQCNGDTRPKRTTKRPVKYADEVQLTSSDEELHIFTPKKKRRDKLELEINGKLLPSEQIKEEQSKISERRTSEEIPRTKKKDLKKKPKKAKEDPVVEPSKAKSKPDPVPKKATKLAPIFVAKQQLDPAALEAKHKFLHSAVPSKLKKKSNQQTHTFSSDQFQTVVHVQQNTPNNIINTTADMVDINCLYEARHDEELDLIKDENLFKQLLSLSNPLKAATPLCKVNVDSTLQHIKKSYPKFPVYRTYHLLKGKSKGEFKDCVYPELDNSVEIFNSMVDVSNVNPDKLNWTDKYRPTSEKQIIGNFESIKELRKWLVTWTENNSKSKKHKDDESDSCDFYQSDADSREAVKNTNNLLIITGTVGTGKTLSVYAVAAELAIKVLEVNASAKRTGKIMLQDLQEATQSHKVNRGKNPMECSQKIPEKESNIDTKIKVMKKRGRKKKNESSDNRDLALKKESNEPIVSQENIRTGMSLILIDDADIVFDQDDGFCSAISQLIQTSKRPVILVTSSLTCPHLQKFLPLAKIIKMHPYLPRMLGTWLDIMCLVDNNLCCPGLGAKTLDYFKGDIRKAINYLQFYMISHNILNKVDDSGSPQGEDIVSKVNADDESSCMSWTDNVGWGEKNVVKINPEDDVLNYFTKKQIEMHHIRSSVNNLNIWWSLPTLLTYTKNDDELVPKMPSKKDNSKTLKELNAIAAALDSISTTDYFNTWQLNTDVTDITSSPWHTIENPSVIDNESLAKYDRSNEVMNDISHELITKSILMSQRMLQCENKTDIQCPSMSLLRERNRVVSRHKTLTSYLNPSALDRRALALDYWPSCRSICRTEKAKTDSNNKRNNRFCHYLKSLNVLCKNDYFDNLSESLHFKNS